MKLRLAKPVGGHDASPLAFRSGAENPHGLQGRLGLLWQWKRWESGDVTPGEFYQPIIAATLGTVTHAIFQQLWVKDLDAEEVLSDRPAWRHGHLTGDRDGLAMPEPAQNHPG